MCYHIDLKFIRLVSNRLDGFTQKNSELFNFRCPFCGDSSKKKSKKRGFIYKKANHLFYKCFNDDACSTNLYNFLDRIDPELAKEYSLETFKEEKGHSNFAKTTKITHKKPVFVKKQKLNIPAISDLSEKHFAKQYVLDRKIPKGIHKDLYFAADFKKFVLEMKPDYAKNLIDNDPRLIIPFRDEDGNLFAFQGRALSESNMRYVTIKLHDELKLFGLDRINKTEEIFVTEGPIDSLFLKNAVATADANLMIAEFLGKDKLILVPDNEPRNSNIVKNITKWIEGGFRVCLFPNSFKWKDINEAIMCGLTKPQLHNIIMENTFDGLRAKMEFNTWKKC